MGEPGGIENSPDVENSRRHGGNDGSGEDSPVAGSGGGRHEGVPGEEAGEGGENNSQVE